MRHAWSDGTYGGIYDEQTDILGLARRNLDQLHAHAFATLITTWLVTAE